MRSDPSRVDLGALAPLFPAIELDAALHLCVNPNHDVRAEIRGVSFRRYFPPRILRDWNRLGAASREQLQAALSVDGMITASSVYRPRRMVLIYDPSSPPVTRLHRAMRAAFGTVSASEIDGNKRVAVPDEEVRESDIPQMLHGFPNAAQLRRLNLVGLDLDPEEMDISEQIARLLELVEREVLPPYSFLMSTGRGLHVLWALRGGEDNSTYPPLAGRPNRTLRHALTQELFVRTRDADALLRPDPSGLNSPVARLRVPGSLNAKSNRFVEVIDDRLRGKRPIRYTLRELQALLAVKVPSRALVQRGARNPAARAGTKARGKYLLGELAKIEQARGGFSKTHRAHAIFATAIAHRLAGSEEKAAEAACLARARACRPPLDRAGALSSFNSGWVRKPGGANVRNAMVAAWLGVTLDEAQTLGLLKIRPDFKGEHRPRHGRRAPNKAKGLSLLRARFAAAKRADGRLPSQAALAKWLLEEHGVSGTPQTVGRWLNEIQTTGARGGDV